MLKDTNISFTVRTFKKLHLLQQYNKVNGLMCAFFLLFLIVSVSPALALLALSQFIFHLHSFYFVVLVPIFLLSSSLFSLFFSCICFSIIFLISSSPSPCLSLMLLLWNFIRVPGTSKLGSFRAYSQVRSAFFLQVGRHAINKIKISIPSPLANEFPHPVVHPVDEIRDEWWLEDHIKVRKFMTSLFIRFPHCAVPR